jgi:SagB-type dehydrogenase family enzyme
MIAAMNTYRLSPYCVLHLEPDNRTFTLVHGLYGSRFELASPLLSVLAAIANGATLEAALGSAPSEARKAIDTLIVERVLIARDGNAPVETDPFRNRLGPLELAVHRGLNEGGYYAVDVDHANPPPVRKTVNALDYLDLDRHEEWHAAQALTQCLTARCSVRAYSDDQLPKGALEQFLSLTARAYALIDTPDLGWISSRNYPSGGARYPLEIYPLVYRVTGIAPGLYHYDPFAHRLARLPLEPQYREALIAAALQKIGMVESVHGRPAVLLVVTAVYARTCWKYRGIPYQLILLETGALYQTMYLAATALGLAPCPIGAFPELAVAELLGLDSRDEGQVGLFALGVVDSGQAAAKPFAITAVRVLDQSPFSGTGGGRAVELSFSSGSKEIVDVTQLRVRTNDDGTARCAVLRGRHWAAVDAEIAAHLMKLSQRDD